MSCQTQRTLTTHVSVAFPRDAKLKIDVVASQLDVPCSSAVRLLAAIGLAVWPLPPGIPLAPEFLAEIKRGRPRKATSQEAI